MKEKVASTLLRLLDALLAWWDWCFSSSFLRVPFFRLVYIFTFSIHLRFDVAFEDILTKCWDLSGMLWVKMKEKSHFVNLLDLNPFHGFEGITFSNSRMKFKQSIFRNVISACKCEKMWVERWETLEILNEVMWFEWILKWMGPNLQAQLSYPH